MQLVSTPLNNATSKHSTHLALQVQVLLLLLTAGKAVRWGAARLWAALLGAFLAAYANLHQPASTQGRRSLVHVVEFEYHSRTVPIPCMHATMCALC